VVEAGEVPGPGQIRNSNGPMLLAQAARAGGVPRYLGIARDRLDSLRPLVAEGLQADILLLSGGVSAASWIWCRAVAGCRRGRSFHKVEMKPGKPVFFGSLARADGAGRQHWCLAAWQSGQCLVCFELFVRPAMRRLRGLANSLPNLMRPALSRTFPIARIARRIIRLSCKRPQRLERPDRAVAGLARPARPHARQRPGAAAAWRSAASSRQVLCVTPGQGLIVTQ